MKETPIIIPVKNGLHLTRECVKTLLAQDVPVSIWLLDNDSQDGTTQWAHTQPINHIHFKPGKSVAASWNFGARFLFSKGYDAICIFNNDAEFRPDMVRHLINDPGLFVSGVGTRDRTKIDPPYTPPNPNNRRPHPDFSAFKMHRECYERMGGFNEECAGGYVEDSFADKRMYDSGILAYCLDLPFLHYGAQTLANADQVEAAAIRANADANRRLFREMYGVEVGSEGYYALFGDWKQGKPPSEEAGEREQPS